MNFFFKIKENPLLSLLIILLILLGIVFVVVMCFESVVRNLMSSFEIGLRNDIEPAGVDSVFEGVSDEKKKLIFETRYEAAHWQADDPHGLPKDSDAITGAYTEEEAEKWIAEMRTAMPEVPKDDS